MAKNNQIIVYTDGACSNNPWGPGGWAATLNFHEGYDVLSGHDTCTTNNRMELTAVVEAIKYLVKKGYKNIYIHSDSAYVVNGVNKGWIDDWASKGWKTRAGNDVANVDLWKKFYKIYVRSDVDVKFKHVKGHAGNTFNEIADKEAKKEVEYAKKILQKRQS